MLSIVYQQKRDQTTIIVLVCLLFARGGGRLLSLKPILKFSLLLPLNVSGLSKT